QKFWELEILDDIMTRWYEGTLPSSVQGETRYSLIQSYQVHIGKHYTPPNMDAILGWSDMDPFNMEDAMDIRWNKDYISH
ncbi:hypothetical protein IW262DRAFT_1281941, partial [Armillaria fumosa]